MDYKWLNRRQGRWLGAGLLWPRAKGISAEEASLAKYKEAIGTNNWRAMQLKAVMSLIYSHLFLMHAFLRNFKDYQDRTELVPA